MNAYFTLINAIALQVVLGRTILSLLTIPLWIRAGLSFAGI